MACLRLTKILFASIICLLLHSCQGNAHSFVGFTFGGGGNTFSCEPAKLSISGSDYSLTSSSEDGKISIKLYGSDKLALKVATPLSEASMIVPGYQGEAKLVDGQLVLQSVRGQFSDGSFELKVKTEDGRTLAVVGSFTADTSDSTKS